MRLRDLARNRKRGKQFCRSAANKKYPMTSASTALRPHTLEDVFPPSRAVFELDAPISPSRPRLAAHIAANIDAHGVTPAIGNHRLGFKKRRDPPVYFDRPECTIEKDWPAVNAIIYGFGTATGQAPAWK